MTSELPAPATSTPTAASWRDGYTATQLTAYDEAAGRFSDFEAQVTVLRAQTEVTPAARRLFRQFFPSPAWRQQLDQLQTLVQAEVTQTGAPLVLSSRATAIDVGADGGAVSIHQCVDYTSVRTTQYGSSVPVAAVFESPVERTVVLQRTADGPWLIYEDREPEAADARPCSTDGGTP